MEDKIRRLCREILAANDDNEQLEKLDELRHELHLHIEGLRARFATYPVAQERRIQNGIPPPDRALENSTESARPITTVVITNAKANISQTKPDRKDGQGRPGVK